MTEEAVFILIGYVKDLPEVIGVFESEELANMYVPVDSIYEDFSILETTVQTKETMEEFINDAQVH